MYSEPAACPVCWPCVRVGGISEKRARPPVVRPREADRSDSRACREEDPRLLEIPTKKLVRLRKPRGDCRIREVRMQTPVPLADLVPGRGWLGDEGRTGPGRSLGNAQLRGCLRFAGGVRHHVFAASSRIPGADGNQKERFVAERSLEETSGHLRFRPCARLPSGSTWSVVDA